MLLSKRLLPLAGGVLAAVILSACYFAAMARADTVSAWLPPSALTLQKQTDITNLPQAANNNRDCDAGANGSCTVSTPYGFADATGAVSLSNDEKSRPVLSYIDGRQRVLAIPNSNVAITFTTEPPYGFYTYFNYNFPGSIKMTTSGSTTYYQMIKPPDGMLADASGHRLAGDYASMSFSENGEWMVISSPNVAMLRVNLQTLEVLPFTTGFNYSIGLSPAPQTAISNDGRYAVVASKDFARFGIYDLDTCADPPATITGPASCQSRDLQSLMQNQVPGYVSASHLRFISDDTLSLYSSYTDGSSRKTAKYLLSTADGIIHQQDDLALGDSYISGEGAYDYLPGTDTSENQCHVSRISYPLLMGHELNYNSYHSVACSGATTSDITNLNEDYSGQVKHGLSKRELIKNSRIPSIITNFQQGYIDQLDFVKQYQPKVITVSVGGNDIGFSAHLRSCLDPGTCYSTYEDRLEFVREVNHAFPKLVDTYTKLKTAGAPDARIYAIGYPQIALPGGDCAANVHMNSDELAFAEQAISYLDAVLSQAAAKAGIFYVDTQDAFFGHRLCEAGPGSVAMNGITAGNDFPDWLGGPIGRESYHPNDFGHLLLENYILSATYNMTSAMPAADLSARPPAENGQEILNAPRSGRTVNVTEYDPNLSDELAYRQVPTDITIDGATHALAPGTSLKAELHSTPTPLGTFTADAAGNLSAQITVPADVPAGYHTLHFYGTDLSGQLVDIYKIIYVANIADDLNGDGIADVGQACVGVPPAGQDFDKDGIDDACDGTISQPPPASPAAPDNSLQSDGGSPAAAPSQSIPVTSPTPTSDSSVLASVPLQAEVSQPDIQTSATDIAELTPSPPDQPGGKVLGETTFKPTSSGQVANAQRSSSLFIIIPAATAASVALIGLRKLF